VLSERSSRGTRESSRALAPDPATPLWRAAQVFRLLSVIYALGFQIAVNVDLERPIAAWALFGVLVAWNIACAVAYLQGFGRRAMWVAVELVVVVVFVLSTATVASDQWMQDNQPWATTLWATNVTISAAIQFGPILGMGAGLVVIASSAVLKDSISVNLGRHATIVIELAVGLAVGMAALTARRAHAELERATRLAAALEERERLSREVHDGAIQVLALVSRRSREIGGPTAELGELAGEQERALRRLVSAGSPPVPVGGGGSGSVAAEPRVRSGVDEPARNARDDRFGDRHRTRRGRRERTGQRRRSRGRRGARLRAARGPRRVGRGQHPRRRRRYCDRTVGPGR